MKWIQMGKKYRKSVVVLVLAVVFVVAFSVPCFAATGDVSAVIESTWNSAATQIKTVVNKVVFPALDMILVIAFFVKLGSSYFEFRKHGQMEWTPAVILFASLVFTLTAPLYIWQVLGI